MAFASSEFEDAREKAFFDADELLFCGPHVEVSGDYMRNREVGFGDPLDMLCKQRHAFSSGPVGRGQVRYGDDKDAVPPEGQLACDGRLSRLEDLDPELVFLARLPQPGCHSGRPACSGSRTTSSWTRVR